MTMTDPIADMLTRVRNANVAMLDDVRMPSSKQKLALAAILKSEGYIEDYAVEDNAPRHERSRTYHSDAALLSAVGRRRRATLASCVHARWRSPWRWRRWRCRSWGRVSSGTRARRSRSP